MRLPSDPSCWLGYCMNIHAGQGWNEQRQALSDHVLHLKERLVAGKDDFGVGLRLSAQAVADLKNDLLLSETVAFLREHQLVPFTVNAFPYGVFHGARVKEAVYHPDWSEKARLDYTADTAAILAALLPPEEAGSISTVPVGFKPDFQNQPGRKTVAIANLARLACRLHALEEKTGRWIHVGLEPEPGCVLETTEETVRFFEEELWREGADAAAKEAGISRGKAEEILRRHLGVCVDTCHLALQFESLADSVRALKDAGILISKIQISSALRTFNTPAARKALKAFAEPVYFHQTHGRSAAGAPLQRWVDLDQALEALPSLPESAEIRVHYHVPLFWQGADPLFSTGSETLPGLAEAVRLSKCRHLEVETYTFDVLPPKLRTRPLLDSLEAEMKAALGAFPGVPLQRV
jgi:sugar phosphate isomerase/epimerase